VRKPPQHPPTLWTIEGIDLSLSLLSSLTV
jgi:hypothetical protein